jgi:hypothetical protein
MCGPLVVFLVTVFAMSGAVEAIRINVAAL